MAFSIGTNLPHGFAQRAEVAAFYNGSSVLDQLRAAGFVFVELSLQACFDEAAVLAEADACVAAGLRVDLHPYHSGAVGCESFDRSPDNPCRALTLRYLELAGRIAQRQDHRCVVNFHPASNARLPAADRRSLPRRDLAARSRDYFNWMGEEVAVSGADLLLTAELQNAVPADGPPGLVRIGDRCAELEDVTPESDNRFGLCWDTGHGYLGHLHHAEPVIPPNSFLRRVRHIHLHDVDGERDHVPPGYGQAPMDRYMAAIRDHEFGGDLTVEMHHRVCAERGLDVEDLVRSLAVIHRS